jgi:hypothetical protein
MQKPAILVYGNCQAQVLGGQFNNFQSSSAPEGWDVICIVSFDHPTEAPRQISDDDLKRCVVVFEQADSGHPFPQRLRDALNGTKIIRFPPLDFNLYWPFNFNDPRNVSEPDFPWGRFPYGDRVVIELLREGLAGDGLWQQYQARSLSRLPDLNRLEQLETRRLQARDAACDVVMADLVLSSYRDRPLFWTINHPSGWLLGHVLKRMMAAAREPLELSENDGQRAFEILSAWDPFSNNQQPIHPEIARRLGLAWCTPERRYRYLDGNELTFEEFMVRYINFQ